MATPPADVSLWTYVPPAIVSAFIGASIGYLTSRAAAKRTEWHARVDDVVKALDTLRGDVLTYWCKSLPQDELAFYATSIGIKFHDINNQFVELKLLKSPFNSSYITSLLDNVFDASTGGDFESPNRQIANDRAVTACLAIDELKLEAHRCRRRAGF
jgi:hypothetical protein